VPNVALPTDRALEARFGELDKEGLEGALEQRQYIVDHYIVDPATGEGFVEEREKPMSAEELAIVTRELEWLKARLAR
jgi:hypothetical protein